MRFVYTFLVLCSFSVWAVETSTSSQPLPLPTTQVESPQAAAPVSKKQIKAKKNKKAVFRAECIKDNPSLRLAKNKKRLARCIKRKSH